MIMQGLINGAVFISSQLGGRFYCGRLGWLRHQSASFR